MMGNAQITEQLETEIRYAPAGYQPVYTLNANGYLLGEVNTRVTIPTHSTGNGKITHFSGATSEFPRIVFLNNAQAGADNGAGYSQGNYQIPQGYKILFTQHTTPREIISVDQPVKTTVTGRTSSKKAGIVQITCTNGNTDPFHRLIFAPLNPVNNFANDYHVVAIRCQNNQIPIVTEINSGVHCTESGNNQSWHVGINQAPGSTAAFARLTLSMIPAPLYPPKPIKPDSLFEFISNLNNLAPTKPAAQPKKPAPKPAPKLAPKAAPKFANSKQKLPPNLGIFAPKQRQQISPQDLQRALLNTLTRLDEDKDLIEAIRRSNMDKLGDARKNLQRRSQQYGLTCDDVPGDGSCFFHSTSDQLRQNGYAINHEKLREIAVDHIFNNLALYKEFMDDFEKSIQRLLNRDEWADHMLILALSRALKLSMILVRSNNDTPTILRRQNATLVIYLGYEAGLHYLSLHRGPAFREDVLRKLLEETKEVDSVPINNQLDLNTLVTTSNVSNIIIPPNVGASASNLPIIKDLPNMLLQDELITACEQGNLAAVKSAVAKGAKANLPNKQGKYPLATAAWVMHSEIINYFFTLPTPSNMNWEEIVKLNTTHYGSPFIDYGASAANNYSEWYKTIKKIEGYPHLKTIFLDEYQKARKVKYSWGIMLIKAKGELDYDASKPNVGPSAMSMPYLVALSNANQKYRTMSAEIQTIITQSNIPSSSYRSSPS